LTVCAAGAHHPSAMGEIESNRALLRDPEPHVKPSRSVSTHTAVAQFVQQRVAPGAVGFPGVTQLILYREITQQVEHQALQDMRHPPRAQRMPAQAPGRVPCSVGTSDPIATAPPST
jgi:hypothetical protein